MSGGIRNINFTITSDAVHADLDLLLRILHDMRRTSGVHEADSAEEWRKVSAKFDSLMEGAEAMAIKREKLEELSPSEPSLKRKYMEDDLSMRDLLKHRERMHMKELTSNRNSINSLIDGKIKLAESFKSCISILCRERDYHIRELKEEIADLQEQLKKSKVPASTLSASINMVSFDEAMSKAWKDWAEDPNSDKDHPVIRFEFDANVITASNWDDEYLFDFHESAETVDRRDGDVDRHSEDCGSSDDEIDLEKIKYIRVWGPKPDTPAIPRQVMTKVSVIEDLQEEEGKLQPVKIIERDNTMEAIFMDCIEDKIGKPLGLCLLDTGASLSVTSMETVDRLGLVHTVGKVGTVDLIGGEKMDMLGLAEDVHLRIGDAVVKVDLYIVDIAEDRVGKTILGAGFLRAVGAVIDYDARRISFNKIDPTKFYDWVDISSEFK